jgi:hypothetical protein
MRSTVETKLVEERMTVVKVTTSLQEVLRNLFTMERGDKQLFLSHICRTNGRTELQEAAR